MDATTERPILTPKWALGLPLSDRADDGRQGVGARPKWSRFTGTVLPGNVLWLVDDNIGTKGTTNQAQLIVSAPDKAVVLVESTPLLTVLPETLAGSLEAVAILRSYVAVVTRHPSGTATVTSAAYTSSLV